MKNNFHKLEKESLATRIEALIKQQIDAGIVEDYFSPELNGSGVYYLDIGTGGKFKCQVNPKRDPANRALLKNGKKGCFLCEENMPDEEEGIDLDQNWKLYPNPRPYERNHTVMVLKKTNGYHPFQVIDKKAYISKAIDTIWQLGSEENRPDFNLTFNSIKAGASSRHFHFQIFECKLPIEDFPVDFKIDKAIKTGEIPSYPAGVLVIEGKDKEALSAQLWYIIDKLNSHQRFFVPYVLLFKVVDGNIRVYIYPRAAESPADTDSELINTKFGICEMSGMTIVYNGAMANQMGLEVYERSLKAASNAAICDKLMAQLMESVQNPI